MSPKFFRRGKSRLSNRTTNKYGASKVQLEAGGRWYDSRLEADYRRVLEMMQTAGEISELIDQPQIYLTDALIGYRPDFAYWDNRTKQRIFVEAKGVETEGYRIKLKLWTVYGPGPLFIVKRNSAKELPGVVRKVVPKDKAAANDGQ